GSGGRGGGGGGAVAEVRDAVRRPVHGPPGARPAGRNVLGPPHVRGILHAGRQRRALDRARSGRRVGRGRVGARSRAAARGPLRRRRTGRCVLRCHLRRRDRRGAGATSRAPAHRARHAGRNVRGAVLASLNARHRSRENETPGHDAPGVSSYGVRSNVEDYLSAIGLVCVAGPDSDDVARTVVGRTPNGDALPTFRRSSVPTIRSTLQAPVGSTTAVPITNLFSDVPFVRVPLS